MQARPIRNPRELGRVILAGAAPSRWHVKGDTHSAEKLGNGATILSAAFPFHKDRLHRAATTAVAQGAERRTMAAPAGEEESILRAFSRRGGAFRSILHLPVSQAFLGDFT